MPDNYCVETKSHFVIIENIRDHILSSIVYVIDLCIREAEGRHVCPNQKCASTMNLRQFFLAPSQHALCVVENYYFPALVLGFFGGIEDEADGFIKPNDVSNAFAAIKEEPKSEDAAENAISVMGVFKKVKEIMGLFRTLPDVPSQDTNLPTEISILLYPYIYGSHHSDAQKFIGFEIVELMIGNIGENEAADNIIEGEVKRALKDRTMLTDELVEKFRNDLLTSTGKGGRIVYIKN